MLVNVPFQEFSSDREHKSVVIIHLRHINFNLLISVCPNISYFVYANIILENSEDQKKLWKSLNNILHRFPAPSLPENISLKTICEKFSNFFLDKITIIRSKFSDNNELQNVHPPLDIIL